MGRTEVSWGALFEPAGAPVDALTEGIRPTVLEIGLQGLEDRVRSSAGDDTRSREDR